YRLAVRELCRLIRDAGYVPAQRDQYYHILQRHDGPESPDLVPDPNPPLRTVKTIDKTFIGRAPGMEPIFARLHNGGAENADRSTSVALPILGDGH
ncbi:MAG: hypothetical protein ACTHM6_09170, partial [Tepidisphaeraceae bacterium]